MKKYFTKYLPVEGEIKIGTIHQPIWDKELSRIRYFQLHTQEMFSLFKEMEGYKNNNYKPVKLFLCSKDIQVGDKYRMEDAIPDDEEYTHQKGLLLHSSSYKVIGEVSPDAVWVTEGMEFDEDEIAWISDAGDDIIHELNSTWEWEDWNPENQKWAIKCPTCKTFH